MEGQEGDRGGFKGGGGLFGVNCDKTDKEVGTGGQGILPDDIVEGELHPSVFLECYFSGQN